MTPGFSRQAVVLAVLGVGLIGVLVGLDQRAPAGRRLIKISGVDTVGYFATAHSLLFDRDFDLRNQYGVLRPVASPLNRTRPETGLPGSPWPIGTSLLLVPFLALGTAVDFATGATPDGYGTGAVTAYFIGFPAFVVGGMIAVLKLLHILGRELDEEPQAAPWLPLVVVLLLLPGTTLGYYCFSPISHAAGFMSVSAFLLFFSNVKTAQGSRSWALLGLAGGVMVLCRWQNGLYLAGPFLGDAFCGRRPWTRAYWCTRASFVLAAAVTFVPQMVQWAVIYGHPLVNPQGEDFLQFPPQFVPQVLFSSLHGWYSWTPLTLIGTLGLLWGSARAFATVFPWTFVLASEVAVVGSIPSNWFMGEGFGIRGLTCSLPVVAIGLYIVLRLARGWAAGLVRAGVAISVVWSALFAVQYRLDLLPKADYLTPAEMFTDKALILRARERHRENVATARLLEEGKVETAFVRANATLTRLGESREGLKTLMAVQEARGDLAGLAAARRQLDDLLRRRLP